MNQSLKLSYQPRKHRNRNIHTNRDIQMLTNIIQQNRSKSKSNSLLITFGFLGPKNHIWVLCLFAWKVVVCCVLFEYYWLLFPFSALSSYFLIVISLPRGMLIVVIGEYLLSLYRVYVRAPFLKTSRTIAHFISHRRLMLEWI